MIFKKQKKYLGRYMSRDLGAKQSSKLFWVFPLLCVLGVGGFFYKLDSWGKAPLSLAQPIVIEFPKGTTLQKLTDDLTQQGVISNEFLFKTYMRWRGNYRKFQAGSYQFTNQVNPDQVIQKMTSGETYNPIVLQLTIPEGFTLKQIITRMEAHQLGTKDELWKLASDKNFLNELQVPSENLEGFIYPATYNFTTMPSGKDFFKETVKTFFQKLPEEYAARVKLLNLNLLQAITFASLIQSETKHDDERMMVSEVIWHRLKDNDYLAIDSTLIYGIKDYQGDLKWSHLKDKNNLFNTRVHRGLPPHPIGSPSQASLLAVLEPTQDGYYYFVLVPNGEERHHFSKTLNEHNNYVKMLVGATKNKKGGH